MRLARIAVVVALVALMPNPFLKAEPGGETRDLSWFLERMRTVDHLPELEDAKTMMASTWDMTGGNADGLGFKNIVPAVEGRPTRNILLDASGPGCIHRIFTGTLTEAQADTRIQIFLDNAEEPLIDMPMLEFFDYENGPFPYPLVFHKSYPGTLFPIPFAERCVVRLVNENHGADGWDLKNWGNFWQVTWTRYPNHVDVESLKLPFTEAQRAEIDKTARAWLEAESTPPAPPETWEVEKELALAPGEHTEIPLSGPAEIRELRVRTEPASPEVLTNLWMRISWDGGAEPSVDVPVGHFFGHAFTGERNTWKTMFAVLEPERSWEPMRGERETLDVSTEFHSLLLGRTGDEVYSRFPMPFAEGATVSFHNESKLTIDSLRVRIDVQAKKQIPENRGRFHATLNQAPAATEDTPRFGPQDVPGQVVLEREGRGKYVGMILTVEWPHFPWWGEGDILIWTDEVPEAWPPDYHGTGTEEYFNSGWVEFDRKAVSGFVALRPGHPTVYSFHLNDAFQFQRQIRVVEEQWWWEPPAEKPHPMWTSTAFWYGLPAHPAGSHVNHAAPGADKAENFE